MLTASFIIPCKGRLAHLKTTLASKLNQKTDCPYDLIVVDYTCPDGTNSWVESQRDARLKSIIVPSSEDYFNNSHCRNCGANASTSDIVIFSDADCFIHEDWLQIVMDGFHLDSNVIGFGNDYQKGDGQVGRGTWAVRKSVWQSLRGYDEHMEGWGAEELDFLWRMQSFAQISRAKVAPFERSLVWTIDHQDTLRTQFYDEKDKDRSNMRNFNSRRSRGLVNPYGFGELSRNNSNFNR